MQSNIIRERAVCVDDHAHLADLPLPRATDRDDQTAWRVEFRRAVHFAPNVIENMVQAALAALAPVACNDYGRGLPAQHITANGSVHASDADNASLVVFPSGRVDPLRREWKMRSDAWCFELTPHTISPDALPRVTTIIRFHKNARLHELMHALSCLYVMRDCVVVPLIAAQDLSPEQTAALTDMLQTFDWPAGAEPIVDHYKTENGQGDLRSRMLNESLRKASTKYAAFLDYDDLLFSDAYAWLIQRLQATGKAIGFGRVYWTNCNSQMQILTERLKAFEYGGSFKEFVGHNHAPLHSIFLDVEKVDVSQLVYFDDQKYMEDYLMTLQIITADNSDWTGLADNFYLGDYIHSIDRAHTLALADDDVRESLHHDPVYMLCARRINDMRNKILKRSL